MRGASLVEVLIAMFLFSVGGLAVLQMTLGAFRVNDHARSIDGASDAARSRMERLLGLAYNDPLLVDTNGNGPAGLDAIDAGNADFAETVGRYQVFWNIANNQPVNKTKTISVIGTWSDALGSGRRVIYQTIRVDGS